MGPAEWRPMFETFVNDQRRHAGRRSWGPTALAVLVYGAIAAGFVALAGDAPAKVTEKLVEVTFAPPPQPAPAAPPPKRRAHRPQPKIASLAPAPPPVIAPRVLPDVPPPESDANAAPAGGDAHGTDEGGGETEPAPAAETPSSRTAAPINLPEAAEPPVAHESNTPPVYPDEARAQGLEGQVILKIVVGANGSVLEVNVLRGEPLFVEAALAAVRTWTYEPARLDGLPIAVFRIVKIPFRLSL